MNGARHGSKGARIAILVAGAIGLAGAGRAAAFYLGVDRVAFALALVIGAGLSVGIVELLSRVGRADRIFGELARLPRPATLEAIDATSPPLRTVLRARIDGVRATVPSAGFAAYLVGLLVMVGLLGTFVGLVEALSGTRDALGASGDIDALRAALEAPMVGLSRAFGISAAGLLASAMLGLASVFVRRIEAALGRAVDEYGEALRPLTMAERQLALLDALVRQQAEASAAATRASEAVETTATALRTDVTNEVAAVARAVEGAVTSALERAVARASDVMKERLEGWSRVVEREAEERRARDAALADAWTNAASESAERVAREGARALDELRGALGESLSTLDDRLGASIDALAGRLGARTEEVTTELETRLVALTETVDTLVRGLSGELDATRTRLDRTLEATTEALEAHAARTAARDRKRDEAMDARAAELAAAEARVLARIEEHVEAVDAAQAAHLERMRAMHEEAERQAAERAAALGAVLREQSAQLTDATLTVLAEAGRKADAAAAAAERVVSATRDEVAAREAFERSQSERAEALMAALSSAAEEVSARAGRVLAEQAERRSELDARWIAARQAADEAQAERVETLMAALSSAAEEVSARAGRMLDAQAERQKDLEGRWSAAREAADRAQVERAQAVLAELAAAVEEVSRRAADVLAQQAERQAEMESRWLAAQDASAARLIGLLEQHAAQLAEGLASTRALVEEAAGLLRASGVEMSAVAEVFTSAVDRYRDASAASLQALAGVDEAVERAGKKAAIELLTDYLEQTREVFEHSLEVQRELFLELQALRDREERAPDEEKAGVRA